MVHILTDSPLLLFAFSFLVLWASAWTGAQLRRRRRGLEDAEHEDVGVIEGAALTLLALIIGFSFSMAVGRYELRKNYEEAEANAIGTEYVRASLLPAGDTARVRQLLKSYLDQRILFYTTGNRVKLDQVNASTDRLNKDLWSAVQVPAAAQPTPVAALAVSGMNDVLNSQSRTQGAWWNRIPTAAWFLMVTIAVASHGLVGYNARGSRPKPRLELMLPAIVAVSFFLIAEMDSPRRGLIRVAPQNLISLAGSRAVQ
jgi:hypothetical protein